MRVEKEPDEIMFQLLEHVIFLCALGYDVILTVDFNGQCICIQMFFFVNLPGKCYYLQYQRKDL